MDSSTYPLIYIMIFVWPQKSQLTNCLKSVAALTYPNYQIIIVQDSRSEGSTLETESFEVDYHLILNENGGGYCAGCNLGLRHALTEGADYILILDHTTALSPSALKSFLRFARQNPRLGLANPKTYLGLPDQGRPQRLLYTGSWARFLLMEQHLPGINQLDSPEYNQPLLVDYAWGHAMFLQADVLRQIGLFDEACFMYYEDLDLSIRARAAGYEIWYIPTALAWYYGPNMDDRSSVDNEAWFYKIQSRRIFYKKYYGVWRGEILGFLNVVYLWIQFWRSRYWRSGLDLYRVWWRTLGS